MNLRDLKYLVAVAEHCHFGNAAEACFISQPALSMQIKKLEQTLGVQLIERTNKRFLLTDIGKQITEHAKDILYRVDTMRTIAKLAKDPYSGELHLGVIPTLSPYLLPHIIPGLTRLFPQLKMYLHEDQTENLIRKLKHGQLDAAVFGLPLLEEDFIASPLFEEELLLAISFQHPFSKRKSIKQTHLSNKILLLLEDGHCLRDQVLSLCHVANASADKSFQATSLETLRHMIASNAGITLIPKLACRKNDGVCYLPFNSSKPTRLLGMIWRRSTAKKILLEQMVIQIRKLMAPLKMVKIINTPLFCTP